MALPDGYKRRPPRSTDPVPTYEPERPGGVLVADLFAIMPDDRRDEEGQHPCYLCGRATDGHRWIHVVDGGRGAVAHHLDARLFEGDPGEMGLHPIGPECAKRLGPLYVAVHERGLLAGVVAPCGTAHPGLDCAGKPTHPDAPRTVAKAVALLTEEALQPATLADAISRAADRRGGPSQAEAEEIRDDIAQAVAGFLAGRYNAQAIGPTVIEMLYAAAMLALRTDAVRRNER